MAICICACMLPIILSSPCFMDMIRIIYRDGRRPNTVLWLRSTTIISEMRIRFISSSSFDERLNNEKKKTEYSMIEHITKISYGVRCGSVRPFDRSITLLSFSNRLLCDDDVGYELLDEI